MFPFETMTNVRYKSAKNAMHSRQAKETFGESYITTAKATDAKKWNQGHFVTKFGLTLMEFTPAYMHPLIVRGVSIFLRKKMMIDQNIMQIVVNNSRLETSSDFLSQVHKNFWGHLIDPVPWLPTNDAHYIEVETGMMQGILHYTSSAFHCTKMAFMKDYILQMLSQHRSRLTDSRVIVDVAVSSDDSEILTSYKVTSEQDIKRMSSILALVYKVDSHIGKIIGIYDSVKTTNMMNMVSEFNSEFTFHKNTIRPLLRWVTAVNLISEQESLASRQEEMASNLSNVLSGGGSFSLTSHCQIAQALLHYSLLGSSVSAIFPQLCNELVKVPDPGNGFFLMDFPFFAGLTGFKYNLWKAVKTTDLGKCYKAMITNFHIAPPGPNGEQRRYLTLETTQGGSFVHKRIVKWGNRRKHARLIERLDLPYNWIEQFNENPELLYRKSENSKEVLLKFAKKMHSPGISAALASGVNIARIVASSVYIASMHVLSESSLWYDSEEAPTSKTTLFLSAVKSHNQAASQEDTISDEEVKVLFPFCLDYEFISESSSCFNAIQGAFSAAMFRKVNTKIEVGETESNVVFTPLAMVRWKWFGHETIPASNRTKQNQWTRLRQDIIWLRDTPQETLQVSPFESHCQLHDFLSNMEGKRRLVQISGAPIQKAAGISNMVTAARQDFFPGY